jgi:hypothetical protein
MNIEDIHSTSELELLPLHTFSTVSFETIRQMHIEFSDAANEQISLRAITQAFITLRKRQVDFKFSSPEDILEKYQEII